MAEEGNDGQEKTEEPSQRKLEKALEDGKILTSKEMPVFTTLAAGLVLYWGLSWGARQSLFEWGSFFAIDSQARLEDAFLINSSLAFWFILKIVLIVGTPLLFVVIATQLAVGGINFAPKALYKPQKMNPIEGFKRMFSSKSLVELGKAILKVLSLFSIAGLIIYYYMPELINSSNTTLGSIISRVNDAIPTLIGALLIALAIVAAIDYFWERHTHLSSLKMSRQELKDEHKQTEGSPEVRAKIRRMQMETSQNATRQREALNEVHTATAIITNPTHFAVALRYMVGESGAPKVIAMGRGKIAEQIISKGEEAKVTVFSSPLLARALYFTSEIGEEISDKLYNAVAVALAYIYRIDNGEYIEEPNIDIPPDLQLNEHGKPI
ncbi:MAG: flagellar biosynthesis protein FlhB [Paracoccaceae bacterium]